MNWIDREKLSSEVLAGTFLNLGCTASVEIAAQTGFDWLLIDLEHGSGSLADLRGMLLACNGSKAAPIVRIRSLDADAVKFALDSGAAGMMFPFVSSADEARRAVEIMKYPPLGSRGVAGVIRATDYGRSWRTYFAEANARSLCVAQIETQQAVEAADAIAALDGVDVLFVGPMDLSVALGCAGDFLQPHFLAALQTVLNACEKHGKACGILSRPELVDQHKQLGFRFIALSSDANAVIAGLSDSLQKIRS